MMSENLSRRPKDAIEHVIGARHGLLTIVERIGRARWRLVCDCGAERIVAGSHVARAVSCGCKRNGSTQKTGLGRRTHGVTSGYAKPPPEYNSWKQMRRRCRESSNARVWHRYGGRGIVVCAEWEASYASFYADMGPKPTAKHSIDRIDNDGGYWCGKCAECRLLNRPANCRWATLIEQANNTHRARRSIAV
jgi:hypothetical protein